MSQTFLFNALAMERAILVFPTPANKMNSNDMWQVMYIISLFDLVVQ